MNSLSKLSKVDPEIAAVIEAEHKRQLETLELIASENHVSPAVLEALGSVLTDKYAEGYPGRRYYCGNENIDVGERLCIERAKELFGAEHANVQPHSGTSANLAVYVAALKPGDKIMGMRLDHGGHLSHGAPMSISGMNYNSVSYGVRADTEMLDMDEIRKLALKEKPDLIIAGASAYPRIIDFEAFASIGKEVGCPVLADIAHIAGLVAGGVHPSPIGCCDFVTTTNHKTLRGPRGGIILCKAEWAKAIDSAVFPGIQGGPLEHVVAAKAVAFHEAMKPQFKHYVETIIANAQALAEELLVDGWRLVSGGTDNHLLLIDLRSRGDDYIGHAAADWLASAGLIANWNAIPFDPRPPMQASGIRLGTPAVTTRGMGLDEMREIADMVDKILVSKGDEKVIADVSGRVLEMCGQFPIPTNNYQ